LHFVARKRLIVAIGVIEDHGDFIFVQSGIKTRPRKEQPRVRWELSKRPGFYPPILAIAVPIFYHKGMSILLSINTEGDIYPLSINAIGSKEGA